MTGYYTQENDPGGTPHDDEKEKERWERAFNLMSASEIPVLWQEYTVIFVKVSRKMISHEIQKDVMREEGTG